MTTICDLRELSKAITKGQKALPKGGRLKTLPVLNMVSLRGVNSHVEVVVKPVYEKEVNVVDSECVLCIDCPYEWECCRYQDEFPTGIDGWCIHHEEIGCTLPQKPEVCANYLCITMRELVSTTLPVQIG